MDQLHEHVYLDLHGGQVEVEATIRIQIEPGGDMCHYNPTEDASYRVTVSLTNLFDELGQPISREKSHPLWSAAERHVRKALFHTRCVCERHREALVGDIEHALEGLCA